MKKIILPAMTIALLITSCKKENLTSTAKDAVFVPNSATKPSNARIVEGGKLGDYITDETDSQNERVQSALYKYMIGMRKVFTTTPSYLSEALNLSRTTPLKTISLCDFIAERSDCKNIFNHELYLKYPENGSEYDYAVKIADDMWYKYQENPNDYYEPGMYIINATTADLERGYYLALSSDVATEDNEHDYIPAWHFSENGAVTVEILSETDCRENREPVIIFNPNCRFVGGGVYNAPPKPKSPVYLPPVANPNKFIPPAAPVGTVWSASYIRHHSNQVNERFEGSGSSDYRISALVGDALGNLTNLPIPQDVHINYIPASNATNSSINYLYDIPFYSAPSYNTVIHYVTFEYDWYATTKYVTPGSESLPFTATYATERYQTVGNKITGTFLPNQGGIYDFTNGAKIHTVLR